MLHIAFSDIYRYSLPPNHRFPMDKYTLLPEQLLYEGLIDKENFFEPNQMSEEVILRTHTEEYWYKLCTQSLSKKEERAIGFPMRPELVHRGRFIAQGTLDCARYSQKFGVALNIAGGTHHSFADHGEGFCVFNDIALAANQLLYEGLCQSILVIDLDVHQGNGTASIFADDDRVFTFSMHGDRNYPLRKVPSNLDIGLADQTEDEVYLSILGRVLPDLFERTKPDQVFYLSGVDVLAEDKLGRLALSLAGCRRRDYEVLSACKQQGIPVAACMGGGYSPRIATIVDAHANTFRVAHELFE